nr:putative reverse transcriptase, RNA-dependent DNA polymerase, Gag-polypeptide of LTR copia-type [Tanacetum cinerariifolium]
MTGSEGDKGGSSVIDFSSPYYLHPSDSPKQPSVNEVLTDGNYNNWAREMTNFLFVKNKTDFVDGTLKKPKTSSSEYKSWMRCNAMIKGWLNTAMEKGIRDSVKYDNTSSEIWSDLKERFGKESAPRAYELKKKITATRQEGSSVLTYYARLRKKDDKAKPKATYVETGKSPIPGLNEGQYQEFVKFFFCVRVITLKQNPRPTWQGGYRIPSCTRANFFSPSLMIIVGSLDCNKDEPTKVHDDFKSTNFFLDSGEQNCFNGPPQNPSSTTTEDIGSEEENVAQHENDLFANNSPVLGPEIKEDHAISHEEPKPRTTHDKKWRNAMQQEIKAFYKNETWTLEELPEGKRPIDSKWVYKTKFKSNGEVERYKARLVAKGCTQKEEVDYHETFAPVSKLVTVPTLLVVATKKGWIIHQLDVNNAFLHGDVDEEVYMKIPKGFEKEGETRSKADYSLFTYQKAGVYVVILIYVDDVIIVGDNSEKIQQIKQQLDDEFSIKNLGLLKYFLGIEVAKTSDGLVLSQQKYMLDILKDSGMLDCQPSAFPFEQGTKLDKGEEEARVDATQYQRLVGRSLYLQAIRPDVTYAVNVLSQFVSNPRQNHLKAVKRVLRYLKGTPGQGILLSRE